MTRPTVSPVIQPWMNKCSVCGVQATAAHPDGCGGYDYYCEDHEPDTLLTELERNDP